MGMNGRILAAVMLGWSLGVAAGEEINLDPDQGQLKVERGAQARMETASDAGSAAKAAVITVGKPGPLFWNVEWRFPNLKLQAGKRYACVFRAKSSPRAYVYVVPEKATGDQGSLDLGTNVTVDDHWSDCRVEFRPTESSDAARLTFSDLSVDQSTFWFSDVKLLALD
jgi:hypothetical protein